MKCKGNCGNDAIFGSWCTERYYDCPGYKKKVSHNQRLYHLNILNYKLNQQFNIEPVSNKYDKIVIVVTCSNCQTQFTIEDTAERVLCKQPKLCKECLYKQISQSLLTYYLKVNNNKKYEELSYKDRKNMLWQEQGMKCKHCGFNEYTIHDGPYEIHHIDSNRKNKTKENEIVICCNCHYMTDNFRFKNRKHSDESKMKIAKKSKK